MTSLYKPEHAAGEEWIVTSPLLNCIENDREKRIMKREINKDNCGC